MKTFQRICIEDYVIEAANGDRLELKRGEEYITSPERIAGPRDADYVGSEQRIVTVFSSFWVPVPVRIFAGERIFTES